MRCGRVHGSGSEKGGEGCAIRCDGWQDKVFKCHEIQPEQGTRKGRFARSLLATLSEGEGRQEREGGWRGLRAGVKKVAMDDVAGRIKQGHVRTRERW